MPTRPPRWRRWLAASWRPLIGLAAIALVAWVVLGLGPLYRSTRRDDPSPLPAAQPEVQPPPLGGWRPRRRPEPVARGCSPRHERVCLQGDAWWLDSCGNPHELAEDCQRTACEDGACVTADPACLLAPTGWRCDGDVARGCAAGRRFAVDCAAQGRRCVMTQEGPLCRVPSPDDCDEPSGTTHCEDTTLVACVDGLQQRLDCGTVGALCLPGRGGRGFRCVRVEPAAAEGDCGPCGCPPRFDADERCDGRDDDGDGFVDEGVECGVVDIVAFVVTDDGQASYTEDDIQAEVDQINAYFGRDDELGLSFRLAQTVALDREEWLEVDAVETQEILVSGVMAIARESYFVPIMFTDVVLVEEVPRPGLATPPNGTCGGQRRIRDPQPLVGGIIVAKQRWPTTVAHEVGHYLGLCHTHMPSADAVEVYVGEGEPTEAQACAEPCAWEGDGICDTPEDPGPPVCEVDPSCTAVCEAAQTPAVDNLMGYYPGCRAQFSEEQARTMRHGLFLRRGWFACQSEQGCACEPGGEACPEQMSCRQYEIDGQTAWRCGLDGAVMPGGPCQNSLECGKDSTCVEGLDGRGRCTRPCRLGSTACDCRLLSGVDYPLCADDLSG